MNACMHTQLLLSKKLTFSVSTDTHNRCGMYAVAVLVFVVIVALLGFFIHRLTKSGAAGWFSCLCVFSVCMSPSLHFK